VVIVGPEANAAWAQDRPRLDYAMVAEKLAAEILAWAASPAALRGSYPVRVARSFAPNLAHARRLLLQPTMPALVYTTGETWGLPVAVAAALGESAAVHVMYCHRVYSDRWLRALGTLRSRLRVDGWICVTNHQAGLLHAALGPDARIATVSQGVDTLFWDPARAQPQRGSPYVLSVGSEMRDYRLLFAAVRDLDVEVVVKASSAWMRVGRDALGPIPQNVRLVTERLSYAAMRDLYAGASVVTIPLVDTPQAAGITAILEAMSMGKPVVVTDSRGLPDLVRDGAGIVVPNASPRLLAEAIRSAIHDGGGAARTGTELRQRAVACNLEAHAAGVVAFITQVMENA